MKRNREQKTTSPEVIAQLNEWATTKARLALKFLVGIALVSVAGELHPDADAPDMVCFASFSGEVMVTLPLAVYETHVTRDDSKPTVHFGKFGGEITLTQMDSTRQRLLDTAPQSSKVH